MTDTAAWDLWWSLNRERWLRRVAAERTGKPLSGSDEFFLGVGSGDERALALMPAAETIQERVVPALLAALEETDHIDLITAGLLALAKIGNGPERDLVPILSAWLPHSNQEVHETAAVALGVLGEPSAVQSLAQLLNDDEQGRKLSGRGSVSERTRAFAAYGLALVAHRAGREAVRTYVIHQLAGALNHDDVGEELAVACVISLGLVRLENGELPPAGEALRAARSRQAQMRLLLDLFGDGNARDSVRAQVPVAFARLLYGATPDLREEGARSFIAALQARSSPRSLLLGVVQGLGLIGDDDDDPVDVEIRRVLQNSARQGERSMRHVALLSLARCASRAGTGPPGGGVNETREFLLGRLSRGKDSERPWAALAMAMFERDRRARGEQVSPVVVPALRHALEADAGATQAGAYFLALGLLEDTDSTEAILERLRGGDENVRGYAATALGLLGARSSVAVLRQVATEDTRYRPGLLREICIALALLGDREIVPQLVQRLRSATNIVDTVSSASALGFVGDARAVEPLIAIVVDADARDVGRAFAAVALGLICDKDSSPWNAKLAADSNWLAAPPTLYDPWLGKGLLDLL